MPLFQLLLEPGSEPLAIDVKLTHPIRSQKLKLARISVVKAASGSYDDNYYRLSLPFFGSRSVYNNAHRNAILVPNQPGVRSFEVAYDINLTGDHINEFFQAIIQQKDGSVETSTTLKAMILTFEYSTNRLVS